MVTVLGIDWIMPFRPHETGAIIVKDGKILAAINEDRLTKIKHDGALPIQSIKEVLRISKVLPESIDAIAIPECSPTNDYLRGIAPQKGVPKIENFFRYPHLIARKRFLASALGGFGINCPIYYEDHHDSHAAAAYYTSGFEDAIVVTMDGVGYSESCTISTAEGGEIKKIATTYEDASPGFFYAKATAAIGFKANDGEGKTMGFAAYGNPEVLHDKVSELLKVNGLKFSGNFGKIIGSSKVDVNDKKLFATYRYSTTFLNDNPFMNFVKKYKNEDIAAAAQKVLEDRAAELVRNAVKKTGNRNIALGGGVALNVKMNMAIRKLDCVDDVFIFPNPGDSGIHAGAALSVCRKLTLEAGKKWKSAEMDHAYYGSEYSNDEIEAEIKEYGLEYEKLNDASKFAADAIASGKVIGWFQGAMEYGPRALGNRSVIADPRDPKMKDRINKYLKKRDWFMPFAPSILNEAKEEYFVDAKKSPFMIMAYDTIKEKIKEIPSVVHVDGTARPQTVEKETNSRYWKLIKSFEKNSGIPVVLNTSFNKHGLVIVRTPADALDHLVWGCIEMLVIGDYAVYRKFNN